MDSCRPRSLGGTNMKLHGAWTALITPIRPDMSIDLDGLKKNVEFQVSQGIAGVVPAGTTGESPTLDWQEHDMVVEVVIRRSRGKCGVLAGTGSNSTAEAVRSTAHSVHCGAKAVLVVDCYYNGPSSQELRDEYYAVLAEQFPKTTIVPYIIPGRTGTALSVEDLAILAHKYSNISAVKEATGDLERMARTRSLTGSRFAIMSGDDDLTYTMMTDLRIKADGVISVMSNIAPAAVARMVKLAAAGDTEGAARIRDALAPLFSIVGVKIDNERVLPNHKKVMVTDRYRNPLPIKTLMAGLGLPSGIARKPLGRMSRAGVEVIRQAARQVWQNNPEVLAPAAEFYGVDIDARLSDDSIWSSLAA